MSNPTTASFWNQTVPAVPTGDQACVIQSDGVTPQDSRTVYVKTATNSLRGVVKPDTTSITVDGSGTLSAKPMVGDTGTGGAAGIVPAPPSGSAAAGKYLKADSTWAVPTPPLVLEHNGSLNGSQALLNLKAGNGIRVSDDGSGGITVASSAGSASYAASGGASAGSFAVTSGANTITLTYTAPTGNAVLIGFGYGFDNFNTPVLSATDSAGNAYFPTGLPSSVWYGNVFLMANNVVGGALTITLSATVHLSGTAWIYVTDFSGVATSSPLDGSSAICTHDTDDVTSSGSITTTVAGDLLVGICDSDGAAPTSTAGFDLVASFVNVSRYIYIFTKVATVAGTYANTVTYTGAVSAGCNSIFALKGNNGGVASFNGRTGAIAPASGDYTAAQVTGAATQAGIQQESYTYGADSGSANAYAVTLSPAPTIVAGSVVSFKATNANTGASTLALNGGTATGIRKNGTTVLAAGDVAAGQIIDATYDGTYWQIIAPTAGIAPGTLAGVAGVTIDGGGSVPTTGSKGFVQVPYAGTITGWTLIADASGSASIDVKKSTFAGFPTTASIVASAAPVVTSAQAATSTTLTGWTTAIAAGDVLEFVLSSVTTCKRLILELKITRT